MMYEPTAKEVMELRRETGLPVNDCRSALIEATGDSAGAIRILKTRGNRIEESRAGKQMMASRIFSYVHQGRIGVLLTMVSESDFVLFTEVFENLGKELCLQVAAMRPRWVRRDDVPAEVVEEQRQILREQTLAEGKPEAIVDKIVEGRMGKFYAEVCLYEQASIRDPKRTAGQMVADVIGQTGEKIEVGRFVREEV